MSLLLKTWERVEYRELEGEGDGAKRTGPLICSWTMGRPSKALRIKIQAALARRGAQFVDAMPRPGETPEQAAARIQALPREERGLLFERGIGEPNVGRENVEAIFRELVRDVEGVVVDGAPVTTGEGLYEVADPELEGFVVDHALSRAKLLPDQGKVSASPSTSSAEEATRSLESSASPAPRTESEASPTH